MFFDLAASACQQLARAAKMALQSARLAVVGPKAALAAAPAKICAAEKRNDKRIAVAPWAGLPDLSGRYCPGHSHLQIRQGLTCAWLPLQRAHSGKAGVRMMFETKQTADLANSSCMMRNKVSWLCPVPS